MWSICSERRRCHLCADELILAWVSCAFTQIFVVAVPIQAGGLHRDSSPKTLLQQDLLKAQLHGSAGHPTCAGCQVALLAASWAQGRPLPPSWPSAQLCSDDAILLSPFRGWARLEKRTANYFITDFGCGFCGSLREDSERCSPETETLMLILSFISDQVFKD